MPCYHPLKAQRDSSGVRILSGDAPIWSFKVPCGQCIGCRLERSRQWALRCVHEASLHEHNSYITLTYNDNYAKPSLDYRDFQLFMKRLRKKFNSNIRFYMCGEYGEENDRPHFHAILFNHTFTDLYFFKRSPTGKPLFRSACLEKLWPYGYSSIGAVTFESAAYVARYVMKKVTGDISKQHYEFIDINTGEVLQRTPEFNRMSLRPAIGKDWFLKYTTDVFPQDVIIHDGTSSPVPRYYTKLLNMIDSNMHDVVKAQRIIDNDKRWRDNTPQRLLTKEKVKNAQLSQLKRSL